MSGNLREEPIPPGGLADRIAQRVAQEIGAEPGGDTGAVGVLVITTMANTVEGRRGWWADVLVSGDMAKLATVAKDWAAQVEAAQAAQAARRGHIVEPKPPGNRPVS